jgi:hypothetical protein
MFALVAFEHGGAAQEVVCFGTEKYGEAKGISIGIDLPSGTWHIIVVLVQALWAPDGGSADAFPYLLIFNGFMIFYPGLCRCDGFLWCIQINLDYCGC